MTVVRGTYKGREGKVVQVYRKKWVIHVERITREKVNGERPWLGDTGSGGCEGWRARGVVGPGRPMGLQGGRVPPGQAWGGEQQGRPEVESSRQAAGGVQQEAGEQGQERGGHGSLAGAAVAGGVAAGGATDARRHEPACDSRTCDFVGECSWHVEQQSEQRHGCSMAMDRKQSGTAPAAVVDVLQVPRLLGPSWPHAAVIMRPRAVGGQPSSAADFVTCRPRQCQATAQQWQQQQRRG